MTALLPPPERFSYELPAELEASEPPEARGLTRDAVRMLVTHRGDQSLVPSSFTFLTRFLEPGDLVVVNTSGTIPAAVEATGENGDPLIVHLSTQLDGARWVVEPRRVTGRATGRWKGPPPGPHLLLEGGASLDLDQPYGAAGRLWVAHLDVGRRVLSWLAVHGRPIRYSYVDRPWPIEMYQNVYATVPGSAEMPSAGRPFTPQMITRLVAMGVGVSPVVLHTGVASLEADEVPYPERVCVPQVTADRVNQARATGHRVIAVGTTVVRALESAAGPDGMAHGHDGWTELVISPDHGVRLTDGMLTGWHEPASSHLLMLEALTGRELLAESYHAALAQSYRWHEFGDVHLILP
ncbi:MAG: S-adenosylmethionine:tRNA ribosyltransferase-isomerase [Acidimicrobiales bacterium]